MSGKASACARCGWRNLWHITRVYDHWELGWQLRGVHRVPGLFDVGAVGRFELRVCDRCGHTTWYVQDPSVFEDAHGISMRVAKNDRSTMHNGRVCRECAATKIYHPILEDYGAIRSQPLPVSFDGPAGRLTVSVCAVCGYSEWLGERIYELNHSGTPELQLHSCECGCDLFWRVDPVREYPGNQIAVAVVPRLGVATIGKSYGTFHLDACKACGLVSWTAKDLEQLPRDENAGITYVEGEKVSAPYR